MSMENMLKNLVSLIRKPIIDSFSEFIYLSI
jgi:hypothetical protein